MPRSEEAREAEVLTNPGSGRVQKIASLARRAARKKHGRFLVEGPQGVREAVRFAPTHVRDLYFTVEASTRYREILHEAQAADVYIHHVTEPVMAAMSTDSQGVLAVLDTAALQGEPSLGEILSEARLAVVLTETQDPGNAGTIIRAADAAGADVVLMARGCVELANPKVVRATAGSLFHLPIVTGLSLPEILEALRAAGLTILAADAAGEHSIFDSDAILAQPSAWLMGNEAHGFTPELLAQADAIMSVPIFGHAESLNVATAATLCLYASARLHHTPTKEAHA